MNLIRGNCLDILPTLSDSSIDMILCDLPYGTTACKWDSVIPFQPLWKEYTRLIKPNGAIVLTASQPFTSALIMSNPKMFKYELIWYKPKGTGFLNARKQPMRNHESILVFYKKQPTYNPQKTKGHNRKVSFRGSHLQTDVYGKMNNDYTYDSTERYPQSVLTFSSDTQNTSLHPTQKPVALMEYLIKTYTNEGDTVLDNCMGSGTTGVACKNAGRHFIGVELEQGYYNIAVKRINQGELNYA